MIKRLKPHKYLWQCYGTLVLSMLIVLSACDTQSIPEAPTTEKIAAGFEFIVDPQNGTLTLVGDGFATLSTASCTTGVQRQLENSKDLSTSYESSAQTGKYPFELWAKFTNISPSSCGQSLYFSQPFTFEKAYAKDAVTGEDLLTEEPVVTDEDLGGDGILEPNEESKGLTFKVYHKGRKFHYSIKVHAVVREAAVDLSVWPNALSSANSDPWLIEHHQDIRKMEPRVLLLNFSNTEPYWRIEEKISQLVETIAESTRWHGYDNPDAPVFLEYQIAKYVDLRDATLVESCDGNSTKYPRKATGYTSWGGFDTKQLYTEEFAQYYGYADPDQPGQYLTLADLVDRGIINELWFTFNEGPIRNPDGTFSCGKPYEVVELKQFYDENFNKREGGFGSGYGRTGNGHDYGMPWIGRSLRIKPIAVYYTNSGGFRRGIGCSLEGYGHLLDQGYRQEGGYENNPIPYFSRYFHEYAGFDLDTRYGLPISSFYPFGSGDGNQYPTPTTLITTWGGSSHTVENYVAMGGNVHFAPNARGHYDLNNLDPVMSTIKNWRMSNGPGGEDLAELFTVSNFKIYDSFAPDCQGPWLVYWFQNMPGLDNLARDDTDEPMMNWWPFLFY